MIKPEELKGINNPKRRQDFCRGLRLRTNSQVPTGPAIDFGKHFERALDQLLKVLFAILQIQTPMAGVGYHKRCEGYSRLSGKALLYFQFA